MLAGTSTISDFEAKQNQGKYAVIDFVQSKIEIMQMDLRDQFNTALFSDGSDPLVPAGLKAIANTSDPSAGTLGGISRSGANTPTVNGVNIWQGYLNSVTKALSVDDMVSGWVATSYDGDQPDLICTTQNLFRAYESLGFAKVQYIQMDRLDGGFEEAFFKNSRITWDRACPAGYMFFVTSKNFRIYNMDGGDFEVLPPASPANQIISVHKIVWYGQITARAPRTFGALSNRS